MADIFREVDEEVRRDKALEFWSKYQNYLIAVAVVVVLATAGWRLWEGWKTRQAEAAGARYQAAVQLVRDGKTDEATKAFQAIASSGPPGYAILARFRLAGDLAAKDAKGAAAAFEALAGDASVTPLMQDVARLRAAMVRLDGDDAAEAMRRLEPMAAAGAPFRHTARELLAVAALHGGNYETAAKWLDMLVVDQQTPPEARQRAEALLGLVSAGKPAAP